MCVVLGDVYTEVLEATHPLHRGPTDHKRGVGPLLSLPEVYNQLFSFAHIQRETVVRRAIRAAKRRYREKIESHFQLNDSRRMWQGLKTICSSGNNSSAEVRVDPLLAEELNTFYGRFECNGGGATLPSSPSGSSRQSSDHVITVSEDDLRRELKRVNVRKAAGPNGITGRILRSCANQLAGLFTSIFNESLATSVVPTSFKKSVIIPVPKNSKPSCLNDYRPVALTSTVMKVFERLLKKHICSSIPATLDPLQFTCINCTCLNLLPV